MYQKMKYTYTIRFWQIDKKKKSKFNMSTDIQHDMLVKAAIQLKSKISEDVR